jgi:hypothetical protein
MSSSITIGCNGYQIGFSYGSDVNTYWLLSVSSKLSNVLHEFGWSLSKIIHRHLSTVAIEEESGKVG